MIKYNNKSKIWALALVLVLLFTACFDTSTNKDTGSIGETIETAVSKDNESSENEILEDYPYYRVEDVALYIHQFGKLPPNYITKEEAREIGWSPNDSSGLVVGGNRFANREGLLPVKEGRRYFEADISTGYSDHRGAYRIVYSNDGLIFYTTDHYESFERLY